MPRRSKQQIAIDKSVDQLYAIIEALQPLPTRHWYTWAPNGNYDCLKRLLGIAADELRANNPAVRDTLILAKKQYEFWTNGTLYPKIRQEVDALNLPAVFDALIK